jgi:hypothetical protein
MHTLNWTCQRTTPSLGEASAFAYVENVFDEFEARQYSKERLAGELLLSS